MAAVHTNNENTMKSNPWDWNVNIEKKWIYLDLDLECQCTPVLRWRDLVSSSLVYEKNVIYISVIVGSHECRKLASNSLLLAVVEYWIIGP